MRFDSRLQAGLFLGITSSGICWYISGYLVSIVSRQCSSLIFTGWHSVAITERTDISST